MVDLKGTVHSKGSAEWITWRRTSFPESLHLPWAKGESSHFELLQRANSPCSYVPPGAAQEQRTIQIGIVFKNRHDINKALKRFEFKNRGSLGQVHYRCCAITVET